jgi:DNA topoisomerase-2
MSVKEEPTIGQSTEGDFTMVTFEPDLKLFKMDKLDDDIVSLMQKRVIDLAGITHSSVNVFLNGKKLPVKGFKDYINYYLKDDNIEGEIEYPRIYESPNNRWEVMLTVADTSFNQVSFCNSICTSKGGTHVNHVVDQVFIYFFIIIDC